MTAPFSRSSTTCPSVESEPLEWASTTVNGDSAPTPTRVECCTTAAESILPESAIHPTTATRHCATWSFQADHLDRLELSGPERRRPRNCLPAAADTQLGRVTTSIRCARPCGCGLVQPYSRAMLERNEKAIRAFFSGLDDEADDLMQRLSLGDDESVWAWFRQRYPKATQRVAKGRAWRDFVRAMREFYRSENSIQ